MFSENEKVRSLLCGQTIPTDKTRKDLIHKHSKYFCETVNVLEILPYLLKYKVIVTREAETLRSEQTHDRYEAALDLMLHLPNRIPHWFPAFMASLIQSNQKHIGEEINKEVTQGTVSLHKYCISESVVKICFIINMQLALVYKCIDVILEVAFSYSFVPVFQVRRIIIMKVSIVLFCSFFVEESEKLNSHIFIAGYFYWFEQRASAP